jgi:CPA1 family monovalent cation:H+ antiporter
VESLKSFEFVLVLLVVVALVVSVSRKLRIAWPILLVLAGLGVALIPGMHPVEPDPELVLVLVLPPLLFSAAWQTPIRDLRQNRRPIALLSVGLVVFTIVVVVAVVLPQVAGMPLAAAVALGAIVGPTDAIAATTVLRRLNAPRRIVTILEGESLINDATALTALRLAVGPVLVGAVSLVDAAGSFVVVVVVGIAVGLAIAVAADWLWSRLADPPVEVALSLVLPFAAYLPAEQLGGSGVIAAVTSGLYLGFRSSRILASDTRVLAGGVWQIVTFLLEGFAFLLIGLLLPQIVQRSLEGRSPEELLWLAVIVSVAVIIARIFWVFPATYLPRWLVASIRARDPAPPPSYPLVVSWAGMRGAVSMLAALALPETFPDRELIQFLAAAVIVVTLLGQGLTLAPLLRILEMTDGGVDAREEVVARRAAIDAALVALDELAERWPDHLPLINNLRDQYQHRGEHLPVDGDEALSEEDQELTEHRAISAALINAQREAVIALRDQGVISDRALRSVERYLDLEDIRLQGEL